ncbi:hypothetical protein M0Q50_07895 [bacterium]|jgi:hypothetical protein|nr:hypothetical protein [bacterium]
MKTFEQFNTIDEKEKLFLELAHLDELEIRFDFVDNDYENYIYYFYKEKCFFAKDKSNRHFYIDYDYILFKLMKKYMMDLYDTINFISNMLKKYFKVDYKIRRINF